MDEIAIGPNGAVWLATFTGLARADGDRLVAYVPPADAPRRVRSPFVTAAGDAWVPNENAVLHVRGETAIRYAPKSLDGATAVALVDREGTIWIGTHRSGLLRWKRPVVTALGRTDGLAGQGAMSVYEDRDGTTWVGNWCGGLSRFRDGRFAGRLTLSSIDDACVTSILRTRDGTLWVA